jgi:hypothetical protein
VIVGDASSLDSSKAFVSVDARLLSGDDHVGDSTQASNGFVKQPFLPPLTFSFHQDSGSMLIEILPQHSE